MRFSRRLPGILFLVLIVMLVFSLPGTVFSQTDPPAAQLVVKPGISSVPECDTHQIAIQVADVQNLTAFELRIHFDPTVVEIVNVTNGGFLVPPDEPALYSPDNNDGDWNTDGFIHFGMVQQRDAVTGELNPVSGTGDLILITLQALVTDANSSFEIDETETELVWWGEDPDDPDGPVDSSLIPYTAVDGVVNTAACEPTDIFLDPASVDENVPVGTTVGQLTTEHYDATETFTYTLVEPAFYPDNYAFTISEDDLLTAANLNYEAQSSYQIKVRTTDSQNRWFEKVLTVSILNINDKPLANPQIVETTQNRVVMIKLTGFDEDGYSLIFDVVENPKHGAFLLPSINSTKRYKPDIHFVGTDSFQFTVSDGDLTSDPATVIIIVDAVYYFPIFQH